MVSVKASTDPVVDTPAAPAIGAASTPSTSGFPFVVIDTSMAAVTATLVVPVITPTAPRKSRSKRPTFEPFRGRFPLTRRSRRFALPINVGSWLLPSTIYVLLMNIQILDPTLKSPSQAPARPAVVALRHQNERGKFTKSSAYAYDYSGHNFVPRSLEKQKQERNCRALGFFVKTFMKQDMAAFWVLLDRLERDDLICLSLTNKSIGRVIFARWPFSSPIWRFADNKGISSDRGDLIENRMRDYFDDNMRFCDDCSVYRYNGHYGSGPRHGGGSQEFMCDSCERELQRHDARDCDSDTCWFKACIYDRADLERPDADRNRHYLVNGQRVG